MDPRIWGPHAWFLLHSVTFSYPDNPSQEDKNNILHFFESFSKVIPCILCRNHFQENLKKFPIINHLQNRDTLVNWLIDMHNIVNKKLGKSVVNNQEIIQKFNDIYTKSYQCPRNKGFYNKFKTPLLLLFLLINIIVLLIVCFRKFKFIKKLLKKL